MELRQLSYFVVVAEERHFTRAALRLRLAQSGLSAAVRALERELGTALFVRSTRRVELTEAGRALLTEARRVLAAAEAARDAVAAVQGLLRGRLRIGIMQNLRGLHLARALADFHAAHPDVEIELTQAAASALADQVRTAQLDLAFVALPRPPGGVSLTRLLAVPMELACAADHPLAHRHTPAGDRTGRGTPAVPLTALTAHSFVDFPASWGSRILVDALFTGAGLHRRVRFEVGDSATLLDLVAQGLGVAVLPANLPRPPGVRYLPLDPEPPAFTISAALPDPPATTAAAQVLLDLITRHLQTPEPQPPPSRPPSIKEKSTRLEIN